MNHITTVPLYIRAWNTDTSQPSKNWIEIPIGTELTFIKYGDENTEYSSDPVYANCYSGTIPNGPKFHSKFLYIEPNSWKFYQMK